jgi:hypothetical protein
MEINKDNVQDLWVLYEAYKEEFRKEHYSNVEPLKFEEYVDEITICNNCFRYVPKDDIGTSELAMQDNICEDCIEDGYGE